MVAERIRVRQQFVGHHPDGPNVGLRAKRAASAHDLDDLRRDEGRGAGELKDGVGVVGHEVRRKAEVDHLAVDRLGAKVSVATAPPTWRVPRRLPLGHLLGQDDILRLHVAVDDAARVAVCGSGQDLLHKPRDQVLTGALAITQQLVATAAGQILHDQIQRGPLGVLGVFEEPHNPRVVQLLKHDDLPFHLRQHRLLHASGLHSLAHPLHA
mmetsp:Transcript_100476/g.307060  ORF Transcript_100476/g.307060 Transcript_100476/m.307060 type:complete len:211 (-) Transcript_100476:223-855(-)